MRLVSIGDLVIDYYYKDGLFLGLNGGMTSHNIIANLAKMKIPTATFGVCGKDIQGKLAIESLKKLGVDIDNIQILDNISTRIFHVSYFTNDGKLSFTSKKRCPFCQNKKWYEESLIDSFYVIENIKSDDILVFDNLNKKNQVIIDNTDNKKIIDLGQYFEFEELSNQEIIDKIKNKFEIINFNERVSKYFLNRLKLKSDIELYNLFKPKFMSITRSENGATFIESGQEYNFNLLYKGDAVDSTGAGDAFISSIIKDVLKNNFKYDSNLFEKWYKNSNKLTSKVVSFMGARGHINTLFKVKKLDNYCTCEDFIYIRRKTIKRCNININNLESRIFNALNSSVSKLLNDIDFNEYDNVLFIGAGGSYAASCFASKIINLLYGCNTYSLYPREVLYRNNRNINKVILFSYSGTTNDIINSIKDFNKKNIYLITKGDIKNIVLKTEIVKKNILCYKTAINKSKERGFLSFEGAVVPAAIFLKYYYSIVDPTFDINSFVKDSITYWKNYLDKILNKKIVTEIKEHNLINIFRGDYTNSACYDLESKIIESGVFNCIIHEKKNFSHGRFINYENLNNIYSIYFKQKSTSKYEEELIKYLGDKNIIIESRYDGVLAEFDLLIASQFIIYYIGKILDIDVSKPRYSDDAMNIYFYKGNLE